MAVRKKMTLGPGLLTLSTPGSSSGTGLDMEQQCTAVTIEAKADTDDTITFLSGAVEGGAVTYTWTLSATLYQDMETNGLVEFTWNHKGKTTQFKFVPAFTGTSGTATSQKIIKGVVRIDPVSVGGDVGKRNTSDIEWDIIGDPQLTSESMTVPATPGASA